MLGCVCVPFLFSISAISSLPFFLTFAETILLFHVRDIYITHAFLFLLWTFFYGICQSVKPYFSRSISYSRLFCMSVRNVLSSSSSSSLKYSTFHGSHAMTMSIFFTSAFLRYVPSSAFRVIIFLISFILIRILQNDETSPPLTHSYFTLNQVVPVILHLCPTIYTWYLAFADVFLIVVNGVICDHRRLYI